MADRIQVKYITVSVNSTNKVVVAPNGGKLVYFTDPNFIFKGPYSIESEEWKHFIDTWTFLEEIPLPDSTFFDLCLDASDSSVGWVRFRRPNLENVSFDSNGQWLVADSLKIANDDAIKDSLDVIVSYFCMGLYPTLVIQKGYVFIVDFYRLMPGRHLEDMFYQTPLVYKRNISQILNHLNSLTVRIDSFERAGYIMYSKVAEERKRLI